MCIYGPETLIENVVLAGDEGEFGVVCGGHSLDGGESAEVVSVAQLADQMVDRLTPDLQKRFPI